MIYQPLDYWDKDADIRLACLHILNDIHDHYPQRYYQECLQIIEKVMLDEESK